MPTIRVLFDHFIHFWTFSVVGMYLVYLLFYLVGLANSVQGLNHFGIILGVPFGTAVVPLMGLYCRSRFDLVHMRDGNSKFSVLIWTLLLVPYNFILTRLFLIEVRYLF